MQVDHYTMGTALLESRHYAQATLFFEQSIILKKDLIKSYISLVSCYLNLGEAQTAYELNEQAIAIDPDNDILKFNRGYLILAYLGKTDEAVELYEELMKKDPKDPDIMNNLGAAYVAKYEFQKAISLYKRNLQLNPNAHETLKHLGTTQLLIGDCRGFENYEARLKCEGHIQPPPTPSWKGEDLQGKILLLLSEQGLGDSIQMMRYVPLLQARGCQVILLLQPALHYLAKELGVQLFAQWESLPKHDFHLFMMSLPHRFKTDLDSIPPPVQFGIQRQPVKDRIGIAFRGNPQYARNALRSMDLTLLEKILRIPEKHFICLQKDTTRNEQKFLDDHHVQRPVLTTFSQTAELISSCELVITTDTCIPHLCGSMGVPTWLFLNYSPDWRWLLDREDSPWYPSMRLFRQQKEASWEEPLAEIYHKLTTRRPLLAF
jgi:hypothetical protein